MNDAQVNSLQAGNKVTHFCNGREIAMDVVEIRTVGECVNERSGAYGHAFACLKLRYAGSDLVVGTSIHSDEYSDGEGYNTIDASGNRIRGWVLNS